MQQLELKVSDFTGSLKSLKEDGSLYDPPPQNRADASPVWLAHTHTHTDTHTLSLSISPRQGGVDVYETEAAVKNEFLEHLDKEDETPSATTKEEGREGEDNESGKKTYHLDDSIEVWSDFQRLHLHSKSLLMVPGHFHNE